ncbi:MAG: DUF1801 domain-containing protein [Chloroflexi bacterium]|nr:MAG: DUF1801 domain-containing protein [Chloroflexota bacterium]
MKRDPYVDRWLERKPAEPILRRARDVIMWADNRMGEYLKYGTVQFAFNGDFASFVHHDKKAVTLMFNRGAKIKGKFPHLEGDGPSARFMRFADVAEVEARTAELTNIVRSWCEMMAPPKKEPTGRARSASKARRSLSPSRRTSRRTSPET